MSTKESKKEKRSEGDESPSKRSKGEKKHVAEPVDDDEAEGADKDEEEQQEEEEPIKKHGGYEASGAEESASGFKDEPLNCVDCQTEFIFTVGQQEFYQEKGFTNKPQRCDNCQRAKKERFNQQGGRGGGDRGGYGDRGGGGRGGGGGGGVCYAFQKGDCSRGGACRFSHEGGGGGGGYRGGGGGGGYGDRGGGGGGGRGGGGGGGVCYAFQKGQCDRGGSCRFSHSGRKPDP